MESSNGHHHVNGRTFAAGEQALRLGKPLFVVAYAQPPASAADNAGFIQRGATPILHSKAEGRANVEPILAAVYAGRDEPPLAGNRVYVQQPAIQLQLAERREDWLTDGADDTDQRP